MTRSENLPPNRAEKDALGFLRYLAGQAHLQEIHFLWRPFLPDADDDMLLELAFAAGCRYIVTHNVKDFHGSDELGVNAVTPGDFLKLIWGQSWGTQPSRMPIPFNKTSKNLLPDEAN